jgi:hypothetical protein
VRSQIKLGRIAGITIGLHYSWFIIALLIVLSWPTTSTASSHPGAKLLSGPPQS